MSLIHLPLDDYEIRKEPDGREIHVCTMRQIVKHTIGLDSKEPYTRYGVKYYKPYRNYFNTFVGSYPWPMLEEAGYAAHGDVHKHADGTEDTTDYYLTRKGLDWLGAELGIVIRDAR